MMYALPAEEEGWGNWGGMSCVTDYLVQGKGPKDVP